MTTRSTYAALATMASAAVALGVGEFVAVGVGPRSAPLVAVGGAVIDNVPESAKELGIRLFGTSDKIALQVGIVVVLAGIAGLLGLAAARHVWVGLAGIGVFGAIGVVAAATRVGASLTWALPSLLAAGAAGLTLWLLLRLAPDAETGAEAYRTSRDQGTGYPVPGGSDAGRDAGSDANSDAGRDGPAPPAGTARRRFLAASWAVLGGAAVLGFAGRWLAQQGSVNSARNALTLPTPSGRPAVAPAGADVAGLAYTTSNDAFYRIDTALVVPRIDPAEWTLTIHGRVGRPVTLTFDDLLRRPMIERYVTLACVSNEVGGDLVGNARWLGVPVADLLEQVRPAQGADQVVSRSVDGFTAGTPTEVLLDGRDALIAVAMNGEPLPIDHGFPARMVVPGLYGYVSATKWLAELELTTFADFDAYWIPRGWARLAPVKTQSRIDRPRSGSTVPTGQLVVAGVAWAQHRGIATVEVRIDGGAWREATLAATVSIDTWRLWTLTWDATPGRHTIAVRASDNAGDTQTEARVPPAPDGATGWHTIDVTVA